MRIPTTEWADLARTEIPVYCLLLCRGAGKRKPPRTAQEQFAATLRVW